MVHGLYPPEVRSLGLEFIELSAPDIEALEQDLLKLGFIAIAKHRHKPVVLFRQGNINLIVNESLTGSAHELAGEYGVTVCALGLLVADAQATYQILLSKGAWPVETNAGVMELNIPAIEGIGGSRIFLIDRVPSRPTIYDIDFEPIPLTCSPGSSFGSVKKLTLKVVEGREQEWLDFFRQLFGFEKIEGQGNTVMCSSGGLIIDMDVEQLQVDDNVGSEHVSGITLEAIGLPVEMDSTEDGILVLPSAQPTSLVWRWEKTQ